MNGTVVEETMDGIINIYKERGYTSHDVVAKLRGILHQKKIGHTGTLDPEAEGVLPVCLGKATKVCDLLTDWDKEYRAVLLLGVTTDTQDMTGTVLKKCPVFLHKEDDSKDSDALHLSKSTIRCCIDSFVGEIWQTPPMYSALKVNGKKLYELARQGIEVERQPRKIRIHGIQIKNIKERMIPVSNTQNDVEAASSIDDISDVKISQDKKETSVIEIELEVKCSKGTYIRTLCNDIGEKLGCGGCMSSLLRSEVGPFNLADAWMLSEIEKRRDEKKLKECLFPIDSVFADLNAVRLTPEAERLVRNGNPLSCEMMDSCQPFDDLADRFMDYYSWDSRSWRTMECRLKMDAIQRGKESNISLVKALKNWRTPSNQLRIYGYNWEFLAVYEYNEEKYCWKARKMFLS